MDIEKTIQLRNGQTLTIRPAVREDAARVIPYNNEVAGETDNLTFSAGEFNLTLEQQADSIEQTNSQGGLFLVAEVDGELASVMLFVPKKRQRVAHGGEFGLTVRKKYWGLGIATKVMQYLLEWAEETQRIRKINLRVRTDNAAAIAVYKKVGFQEEGRLTRDFLIDGQFYDCFLMGIHIDPLKR